MGHLIIGTAGHIDHGKSALVKALTGIDPDRLPAEKERGMTIDLGFAHFVLPNGEEVGIVDVPGHERFVKNMLAGATGVDFAILVVAADDSVMPQTREHLQILELLDIRHGLVAVTKIDVVDGETLGIVDEEVEELLIGRNLEGAPIFHVSSITGEGIAELRQYLDDQLLHIRKPSGRSFFRLAVDRSFSIAGFGCVVTGTVTSGRIAVGSEVELLPGGKRVKVRGVQAHGRTSDHAEQGQRAGLNLAGVKAHEVQRGYHVASPGRLQESRFLAGELLLLPECRRPLKNFTKVKIHLGTVEAIARVVFLDRDARLGPAEVALVQFRLEEPVVADRGDRYVIRAMSPQVTIGGGRILYSGTEKISRFQSDMIHYLRSLSQDDPLQQAEAELLKPRPVPPTLADLARELGLSLEETETRLTQLADRCVSFREGRTEHFMHRETLGSILDAVEVALREFHDQRPIRIGATFVQLQQSLPERLQVLLATALEFGAREGRFARAGDRIHLAGWTPRLDDGAQSIRSAILKMLKDNPLQTPRPKDLLELFEPTESVEGVLDLLLQSGEVVRISEDVILLPETFEQAQEVIRRHIGEHGDITAGDLRDRLGTSRKYSVALLEYLDGTGFTQRVGDKRVLGNSGEG